jgi:hypothetical protein
VLLPDAGKPELIEQIWRASRRTNFSPRSQWDWKKPDGPFAIQPEDVDSFLSRFALGCPYSCSGATCDSA